MMLMRSTHTGSLKCQEKYSERYIIITINFKLSPTKWLDASYRISDNFGVDQERLTKQEVDFTPYAISDFTVQVTTASGFTLPVNHLAHVYDYTNMVMERQSVQAVIPRLQGDAILDFHHTFFKDFKTNLIVGNSIWQEHQKEQFYRQQQLADTRISITSIQ